MATLSRLGYFAPTPVWADSLCLICEEQRRPIFLQSCWMLIFSFAYSVRYSGSLTKGFAYAPLPATLSLLLAFADVPALIEPLLLLLVRQTVLLPFL